MAGAAEVSPAAAELGRPVRSLFRWRNTPHPPGNSDHSGHTKQLGAKVWRRLSGGGSEAERRVEGAGCFAQRLFDGGRHQCGEVSARVVDADAAQQRGRLTDDGP